MLKKRGESASKASAEKRDFVSATSPKAALAQPKKQQLTLTKVEDRQPH